MRMFIRGQCTVPAVVWLAMILAAASSMVMAQNLSGFVRSVTYSTTCEVSPVANNTLNPNFMTDAAKNVNNATTACELMGGNLVSTVTIRVNIAPRRVSGGESLVFQLGSLPSPFTPFQDAEQSLTKPFNSNEPDPVCTATGPGQNCTFLFNLMTVTFESGDLVAVYSMLRDAAPYPYAYYWHQCQTELATPSGPGNARISWAVPQTCSTMTQSPAVPQPDAFVECMQAVQPSAGQILNSGTHDVCPSELTPPKGVAYNPYLYVPPELSNRPDQCAALMCPAENSTTAWEVGMVTTAGPYGWFHRLQPQARPLLNARANIEIQGIPSSATSIVLSSFQNGAMQVGGTASAPVIANVLGLTLSSSLVADPLGGGIFVYGTCPDVEFGISQSCQHGVVNDHSATNQLPTDENDLFEQLASNAWRPHLSELAGICDSKPCDNDCEGTVCTVPLPACRKCLLGDQSVTTGWFYVNEQQMSLMWTGGGCNSNGMPQNINALDQSVSEYMCTHGMSGTCVCGYGYNSRVGCITPCQYVQSMTYSLMEASQDPDSVSYTGNMPIRFNPADPNFWVVGPFLCSDAMYGNGDQSSLDTALSTNQQYLGETVSVAKGQFVAAGVLCNVVKDSVTTGIIEYQVQNTGAGVGSYCVDVSFQLPSTVNPVLYTVTNVSAAQCFQVAAGATVQGPPIEGWRYDGPQGKYLTMTLTLRSSVVLAHYPLGIPFSTATTTCNILTPSNQVSVFNGSDVSAIVNTAFTGQNKTDYVCDWYGPDLSTVGYRYYCNWYDPRCFQGLTWWWCTSTFLLRGLIVLPFLWVFVIAAIALVNLCYLRSAKKDVKYAEKVDKKLKGSDKIRAQQLKAQKETQFSGAYSSSVSSQKSAAAAAAKQQSSLLGTAAKAAVGIPPI